MNIKYSVAVLIVRNIEKSRQFYVDVLGQEIEHDFGKNVTLKGGLSLWELRPEHIISQKMDKEALYNPDSNRAEYYFETTDIAAAFNHVEAAGVHFLHLIHEEPWGQQTIRFLDPDNHLIEIGETLPTFLKRMHDEGMTLEQVSKKSSVPLETVKQMVEPNWISYRQQGDWNHPQSATHFRRSQSTN